MRIHRPGHDITFDSAADLSTHQYKFVVGAPPAGNSQQARVNVSGANGRTIGVLQNKPNAANLGAVVRIQGTTKLQVDTSAILVGSPLKAGPTGEGTLGASGEIGAIALEANGGAAVIIEAMIVCYQI
jgi:hypothetical protein